MSTNKPKVFLTSPDYYQESIDKLKERAELTIFKDLVITKEQIIENIKGKDAIFCNAANKIDKEVLDAGDHLKIIGTMSVGVDHIDLKLVKEKGIRLGYTPEVLTEAVAELAVGLLLMTSRRLLEANKEVYNGGWKTWTPKYMCGQGLHESVVGIVGFGKIGSEIARKLKAFRVSQILYVDSNKNAENPGAKEVGACRVCMEDLLKQSDFVVVSCSLTEETKGMFNKNLFCQMKPTSIFINISRGAVVVQEDLFAALDQKIIGAAGLDVTVPEPLPTNHPLLSLPNFTVLPHIASATNKSRLDMSQLTADNIIAGLEGKPMPKEWKFN